MYSSESPSAPPTPSLAGLIADIAAGANDLDRDTTSTRANIARLSKAGVAGLGAPVNHQGKLPEMAALIGELAGHCMSTAFSLWAHRMTIEYLRLAGTPWSARQAAALAAGGTLGVSGMASPFKTASGCGSLDLRATPTPGGWKLSGTLRWASNLHADSVLVTGALADDGRKLIVGVPLGSPGVAIGKRFDLLAMGGTDSSDITLKDVEIGNEQVLSEAFEDFLADCRPTFLVLQSAICLGLARRCLEQTQGALVGTNASVTTDFKEAQRRLARADALLRQVAAAVGGPAKPGRRTLLELRLETADIASVSAGLEIRTAGGRGYARRTDVSRRFREAAFLPVQSPSETQLRWELARLDAQAPASASPALTHTH